MRRTRLRAGLLVVVAAALAGIGYEVSRTVGAHRARTLADLGSDFLPTVAQHIRSFRRIKVEKGRTLWEITARDAQNVRPFSTLDRKSTRLNSSHRTISYAVFCLKKKTFRLSLVGLPATLGEAHYR